MLCLTVYISVLLQLDAHKSDDRQDQQFVRLETNWNESGVRNGLYARRSNAKADALADGDYNLYNYAMTNRKILYKSFMSDEHRSERDLLLFGAFVDDREPQSFVRVVALMSESYKDAKLINHTFSCILHGKDGSGNWRFLKAPVNGGSKRPVVPMMKMVTASKQPTVLYSRHVFVCASNGSWRSWTDLQAAVLVDSPSGDHDLSTLSVPVEKPHAITAESEQIEFGVCHAIAYYHLDPYRLVEWLEMLRLLGVGKVVFYNSSLQRAESKVLEHYQSDGLVELYQFPPLALPETKQEATLRQVLALSHCLYRNSHRFKYIIPIDTDEFIMPRTTQNLSSLISEINRANGIETEKDGVHSYQFRTVDFVQDELLNANPDLSKPGYSHFLRYRHRFGVEGKKVHRKAIYLTKSCSVMFVHFCVGKVPGTPANSIAVEPEMATLNHYRDTSCWHVGRNRPARSKQECLEINAARGNLTQDDSILSFEKELSRNIASKLLLLKMSLD